MNEQERIIEVSIENVRTPITLLKDPTRHLLKIKAVNASDSDDEDTQQSQSEKPPQDDASQQSRAD